MSEQAIWDLVAMAGAVTACFSTLARRHMLSAELTRWHSAPAAVQASLAAQAIVTGAVALSIGVGAHHASQVETLLLVVSGAVSATLWLNLARQELPSGGDSPPAHGEP